MQRGSTGWIRRTRRPAIIMELKYGLISADDHVYEHPEVWTARMSKQKWGDLVPHVQTDSDGSQRWLVAGMPVDLPRTGGTNGTPGTRARDPKRWD